MTDKPVFDYWESVAELADDFGVSYQTAHAWKRRGYIPAAQDAKRFSLIVRKIAPIEMANFEDERQLAKLGKGS